MGPIRKSRSITPGYEATGTKVVLRCVDDICRFSGKRRLVHVVDEDIYASRPSIVIGTVDKFAIMTWQPLARKALWSVTRASGSSPRRDSSSRMNCI